MTDDYPAPDPKKMSISDSVKKDSASSERDPLFHLRQAIENAEGDEERILREAHNQIYDRRSPE